MDPDMRLGIQMTHSDECYRWHHECAIVRVDSLRARIAVLEKVVSEYARHDEDCSAFSFDNKCSCGLRAALDALEEG
jgi:hypothetical protein